MSIDSYRQSHPAFTGAANEPSWLTAVRASGVAGFEDSGYPGPRLEAWKYTSTRSISSLPFEHASELAGAEELREAIAAYRVAHAVSELVFVDGVFSAALSELGETADGVTVQPLHAALADAPDELLALLQSEASAGQKGFAALNLAFFGDGLWLSAAKGAVETRPVHILMVQRGGQAPVAGQLRTCVSLAAHSQVMLTATHINLGASPAFTNHHVTVKVGDGAKMQHAVLGLTGEESRLVERVDVDQSRDSHYHHHASWLGGKLVRSEVRSVLNGPGAEVVFDGLYVLDGKDHVDNHTIIDHAQPHCSSRETYKGVIGGKARGVFDGIIFIREGADKTDSAQSNNNLLLTDTADVKAKPQLEIYADDVKASHGTTVGQLDAQQLWYLQSRGLPREQAERILTEAFVADRVHDLFDEGLRDRLEGFVDQKLAKAQQEA